MCFWIARPVNVSLRIATKKDKFHSVTDDGKPLLTTNSCGYDGKSVRKRLSRKF